MEVSTIASSLTVFRRKLKTQCILAVVSEHYYVACSLFLPWWS